MSDAVEVNPDPVEYEYDEYEDTRDRTGLPIIPKGENITHTTQQHSTRIYTMKARNGVIR